MIEVVGAAVLSGNKVLVCRRAQAKSLPGKWEFPGGKLEQGESAQEALTRELREELMLQVVVGPLVAVSQDEEIRLSVYLAAPVESEPALGSDHDALGWFNKEELANLDFAPLDLPILGHLDGYLIPPDEIVLK